MRMGAAVELFETGQLVSAETVRQVLGEITTYRLGLEPQLARRPLHKLLQVIET